VDNSRSPACFFALSLLPLLLSRIRERGPITVAEFMEIALYHPEHGYYATAPQRSGTHGDFFTSVDVGPLFGELVAVQLAEMWRLLEAAGAEHFDLVEAGAGNGRLARDILDAASSNHPALYDRVRLTLVERSAAARAGQINTIGPHAGRLIASSDGLPRRVTGTILANELLDALPVHVVAMRATGVCEIGVGERNGALVELDMPLSHPALADGVDLDVDARVEVGLAAADWMREAALSLERGFLLLFDYGYDVQVAYQSVHPHGTLMAYRAHRADPGNWLTDPGCSDLTAHVDLAAIRRVATAAGLETLGILDQTYFLLGLGLAERLDSGHDRRSVAQRLAARTLIMPGGLGSTMKTMVFGKGVGRPTLQGTSSGRLT
jgi:SAM-dependent MidA family methyltransferase